MSTISRFPSMMPGFCAARLPSLTNINTLAMLFLAISSCCASSSCGIFDITAQDELSRYYHCESWRLNVELHNIQNWAPVPSVCENYVRLYMVGGQYQSDADLVCQEAKSYAETVELKGDGKDVWILDIDETALSNLPYYAENQFGAVPFNRIKSGQWEIQAISPALKPVLHLYNQLIEAQWTVFFLTGRHEILRNITAENLLRSGYKDWADLILRQEAERGMGAKVFKSRKRVELEEKGYRIWGNMGDQWSDVVGSAAGERTFKLPNPMYYIA